jgi:hypothetical protein
MRLEVSAELAMTLAYCKEVQGELDSIMAVFDVKSREHLKLLMTAKVLRA